MTRKARFLIFAAVVLGMTASAAAILSTAARRAPATAQPGLVTPGREDAPGGDLGPLFDGAHIAFRETARNSSYGRVAVAPTDGSGTAVSTPLECTVVDVTPGVGVCLQENFSLFDPYSALIFDPDLGRRHEIRLEGKPSRARLSPAGGLAAVTVFVTGHSYAVSGFSTATTINDTATGKVVANLEDFAIERDGSPFRSDDFNIWGVTFADERRFFATLASGGVTYLVEGDVAERRMVVRRKNVECPSLSPDGSRVAYKRRVDDSLPVRWRLHVLELASGADTPLAEARNIDDQVEWLDDATVLYTVPSSDPAVTDVWSTPSDGSGAPRLVRAGAASPAVLRAGVTRPDSDPVPPVRR